MMCRDRLLGHARLAWLGVMLSGCATVSITDQSGNTRVERHFGLVSIELGPGTSAVVAEASSFGYLSGPLGISLGIGRNRVAALPQDCRLVLWLDRPMQVEALRRQLGERNALCVINPFEKEQDP